ncbi:heat shock factor protein 2-like [Stegodyphus dumicola]|uniref:heat shock factor protein 2-like n=1 Tax=Stegodyphus dumicola TaxID=202533 RepID=UPI0015AD1E56|nr:heat shock factor protein 2-like [Stegodyphus dumicola]
MSNTYDRRKIWKGNKILLLNMKFPEKLWSIINESNSDAIRWGSTGDTLILKYPKFQEEFLNRDDVFKTRNIASFVRQLNLYGFRKVNRYNEDLHEFKHPLFMLDRRDLLDLIKRKSGNVFRKHVTKVSKTRNFTPVKKYQAFKDSENQCDEANLNTGKEKQRFTLNPLPEPNIMHSGKDVWWSNISPIPLPSYLTHPYYHNDIATQGWVPADANFYKSQNRNNGSPLKKDIKRDHTYYDNASIQEDYANTPNGNRNMYFMFMPGYAPPHNLNMYPSPGFYSGVLPVPGMPLPLLPNNKNSEMYGNGVYKN